jgi:hypothetical protein
MGDDRVTQELEGGAFLLSTGSEHGPDALAPAATSLAARSLSDPTINDHEPEPLLHGIIGRLNTWSRQESEVMFGVLPVSPRRSRLCDPHYRIEKSPIVLPRAARIALAARQQWLDLGPLVIRQFVSPLHIAPP